MPYLQTNEMCHCVSTCNCVESESGNVRNSIEGLFWEQESVFNNSCDLCEDFSSNFKCRNDSGSLYYVNLANMGLQGAIDFSGNQLQLSTDIGYFDVSGNSFRGLWCN